ncbi:MAG: lipopolysaccharide transport periplasmic protein LptA [Pseudomonadota bacterium]
MAQTNIDLGTINADPTAPVEITADSLSVDQDTGSAQFQGNVVIGQGDLRLSAGRVDVIYNGNSGDISRLSAAGGVTFVTATEAAEAQNAEYNLDAGTLVLTGDVLLTQGASAISADTMRIDLTTGAAQMDGRVRTIFNQGDN